MNSTLYSKAIRTPIIGDYLESACIPRDDQSVLAAARYLNDTRYDSGRFEFASASERGAFTRFFNRYCK